MDLLVDEINFNKINDNFYQIYDNKNNMITYNLDNTKTPFGLENFNKKYIINFEINDDNLADILLIENKLIKKFDYENKYIHKSVVNKNKNYKQLLKCRIKMNKNTIITKLINNNKEISIFNLKKQENYNILIEFSGIWIYKNNIGLYINIIKIV